MYTAIYCSRTVFDIAERKRWLTELSMMRILSKTKIDFIGKRGVAAIFSIVLIGSGIAGMYMLGPRILNHDLRGGSTARVVFEEEKDIEFVRTKLDQEDIEINKEEIEFSVSKIRDDNFVGRVFKVDSNIPTYDGIGDAPYDQLSDVLERVFEGELTKLHVNVGETVSQVRDQPEGVGAINRSGVPPALTALSLVNPSLMLQDTGAEQKQEEPEVTAPPAEEPAVSAAAKQDEGSDAGQDPAGDSETPTDAAEQESRDFPERQKPGLQINQNETVTDLTFDQPITGKALKTFLVQTAEQLDITLEEEQIQTDSEDVPEGESATSVSSKSWTVTLDLPRSEEAKKIFDTWSSEFNGKPYFPTTSGVGGQIARETQLQALAAIIASLLGIIAYVWIRFQNVAFGLAAVVALIHDVLIVLGAIALSHFVAGSLGFIGIDNFKISLPIVAALLTIIGYSLNDTIVVFDRIREVRGKRSEITADMINTSICQTLSRTILTSTTTFIVVFILYWFGGDAIHGFAFALVIGVIVGTYSSIFVASPTLLWLMNRVGLNPGTAVEAE